MTQDTDAEDFEYDRLPYDAGEIEDYVDRKGPITYDRLCRDTPFMSPDDIFDCLRALEERGQVERLEGDLEEHGTTRDVWVVP